MPSPSFILLRTQSDERLVALARAGHERAFEAMVERYRRPLLHAARRMLPEARAEDALQQALIAAWTALQRGDEVRDLRAWLYRIVHNTALNALRVSGYDYDQLDEALRLADSGAGDDELERRAVVRQTLASLAALPERQRQALLRTAVSGYSQEEVARDLGISDNAMRQLIHRARVSVRAAATSLTPLPLVTAAASGARGGPLIDRIAELTAGAAPAGATVTLAKTGAAVVLAGGALSGPALVDRPPRTASAAAATATPAPHRVRPAATSRAASATPVRVAVPMPRAAPPARPAPSRRSVRSPERRRSKPEPEHRSRSGAEEHSGERDDDEIRTPSSGSGSGSGESEGESESESKSDHTGGSGDGDGGSETDGSGESSEADIPTAGLALPTPSPTPVATESGSDSSGHGSDDEPETE